MGFDMDVINFIGMALVLISAPLYRIPRGGPSGDIWLRWTNNVYSGSSALGALVWATSLATGVWLQLDLSWYWLVGFVAYLMLAEAFGWSDWWPNNANGGSLAKLSLRGVPLFNPIMGVIYFACYKRENSLPSYGEFLTGWTAWAELLSGAVTAIVVQCIVFALLAYGIS
jgi:hypothetical protein